MKKTTFAQFVLQPKSSTHIDLRSTLDVEPSEYWNRSNRFQVVTIAKTPRTIRITIKPVPKKVKA